MRFLISIAVWVGFVGGLFLYTGWRDARVVSGTEVKTAAAAHRQYAIEITPTFSLEEDPFALRTDSGTEAPLELRLNGRLLPVPVENLRRGRPLKIEGVEGVVVGGNEIHIKASPPTGEGELDNCVRLRLFEEGVAVADATVWGSQGALVSGTVPFTISKEEADHGH